MEARVDESIPQEKPEIVSPAFVLLLGPSGAGKTEIVRRLVAMDPRIVASPVYTDREARENDFGRVNLSSDDFSKMSEEGKFLTEEPSYGNRYAISKEFVEKALRDGKVPIQDYPEDAVKKLKAQVPVYAIYITPPSLSELRRRGIADGRDPEGKRYDKSKEELSKMVKQHFKTENIDDVVINRDLDKATQQVLSSIYSKVSK